MRRRNRHGETKVWHNPLVANGRGGTPSDEDKPDQGDRRQGEDERRRQRRERARIIAKPTTTSDPDELERERLLRRLLAAEGRPAISATEKAFREANFDLPNEQSVWLQMLEHSDEDIVAQAIQKLTSLLSEDGAEPERHAVLDSRLRRIAEFADSAATQEAAAELRRQITNQTPPSSR